MSEEEASTDPATEPRGKLTVRTLAMPADTNPHGDIFGGWVLSQMDIAGGIAAIEIAQGRVVTAAVEAMTFIAPGQGRRHPVCILRRRTHRAHVDHDQCRGMDPPQPLWRPRPGGPTDVSCSWPWTRTANRVRCRPIASADTGERNSCGIASIKKGCRICGFCRRCRFGLEGSGRLPLDRAADRGELPRRSRFAPGRLASMVSTSSGLISPGRGSFRPESSRPAIADDPVGIETEKVRGAHSLIGGGDLLALVVQIGEGEAAFGGEDLHVLERILGIG